MKAITQLHPALADYLSECAAPTHATSADVRAQLAPILAMVATVQQQVAVERNKLLAAELTADDPDTLTGVLEKHHQTYAALERDIRQLIDMARRVDITMRQRDRYAADTVVSMELFYAEKVAVLEAAAAPAALSAELP